MSINKVILLGNLGKDPEIKTMSNGKQLANFSVATTESWKDKSGERKSKNEWHNIVVYSDGLVKVCQYLKKGSKVYLEGQLQTRKWQDKSGNDKYTTEIVLQGFNSAMVLLDKKESSGNTAQSYSSRDNTSQVEELDDSMIPF